MSSELRINKKFAVAYVKKKEHEELSHLRDKYGPEVSESYSSSSSEEEDDDANALTSDVERDFLRTLSLLKSKDPSIYNSKTEFYSNVSNEMTVDKSASRGPVYLKDYERQRLLEKGSMAGVSDSEDDGSDGSGVGTSKFNYLQEQEELKSRFKAAAGDLKVEEEFLVPRVKTEADKAKEDHEYVQWLKGGGIELAGQAASELGPLKEYWMDPALSSDEMFLRDYILNKNYLEPEEERIPRYDEIVESEPEPSDSEDEEALEKQETFERKYNFRFEEPDANLITSYPRTLGGSVRQMDDHRKVKRKERAVRKAKEKETRKEELRRYHNLQDWEVQEKLEKLARVTGNPVESFGLDPEAIQGDFDPDAYDEEMKKVFDDDYYEHEDEQKPVFSDLEDFDEDMPSSTGGLMDTDFNMDADYNPEEEGEGRVRRKRRHSRALQLDPVLERQALESRLKGELFRYREVEPNDFGLSAAEILCSDNKELNGWVSLKRAVEYLTTDEEQQVKRLYHKKARNWKKKMAILSSYYSSQQADDEEQDGDGDDGGGTAGAPEQMKRKKTKLKGKGKGKGKRKVEMGKLSAARLSSYGLSTASSH